MISSVPKTINATITDDKNLHLIPSHNYSGKANISVRVFEVWEPSLYSEANVTINVTSVNDAPVVSLLYPINNTVINDVSVTFEWIAFDAEDDPIKFDLFLGKSYPPGLHTPLITSNNITIKGLDDGLTYYWYVLPSDEKLTGKCLNGTRTFSINSSYNGTGLIKIEFDVESLTIDQGSKGMFNITFTNLRENSIELEMNPIGELSSYARLNKSAILNPSGTRTVMVEISDTSTIPPGNYNLTFLVTYPGGWEKTSLPVRIASREVPIGDDDDGGEPTVSKPQKSSNRVIAVIVVAVLFISAIVLIIIVKRKKEKTAISPIDHPKVEIPPPEPGDFPRPEISPPQYHNYTQYEEFPGAVDTQYDKPVEVKETTPIEINYGLFTFESAVQCGICLGYIKTGTQGFLCSCGKVFHPTCGTRMGKCPVCERAMTKNEIGLFEGVAEADISTEEEREIEEARVYWPSEPQILDAADDFSVSDIFLINMDGLLIKSISFGTSVREGTDEDIMSGMLTAVTDFIKDSFRDEAGGLKTLEYGRMTIYLERGVTFYLALVFRGTPTDDLRKRMRFALIQLWERYKHRLKAWDGTHEGLEGIEKCMMEYLGLQQPNEVPPVENDDYQPPKYIGEILTEVPGEDEMPKVVTIADVSTSQGCYHLYNMLLAKKGLDLRIGPESSRDDIQKARKKIITIYHPDKWLTDKEKATFFMQKINVGWEVLQEDTRKDTTFRV